MVFLVRRTYTQFDGILAMYHDQGLAPFKALSFGNGVNYTAGLSEIRTSPDHGTGFEIAGKNTASMIPLKKHSSRAIAIYRARKEYQELTEKSSKKKINQ